MCFSANKERNAARVQAFNGLRSAWNYSRGRYTCQIIACFAVCFYGADWLADRRSQKFRFEFDFEPLTAQLSWTFAIYATAPLLLLVALIAQPDEVKLRKWRNGMFRAILIACASFVTWPSVSAPDVSENATVSGLYQWVSLVTGRHNHFPSLHVALVVVSLSTLSTPFGVRERWLWAWGGTVIVSTVTTHQHALPDVLGGIALALFVVTLSGIRNRLSPT